MRNERIIVADAPDYSLSPAFDEALGRLGVEYEVSDDGQVAVTSDFLPASSISELDHVCTLNGADLAVVDGRLVIERFEQRRLAEEAADEEVQAAAAEEAPAEEVEDDSSDA